MTLSLFNSYSLNQRAELVWTHGRFLATRHKKDCIIILYHMGEFFAEVWYSPIHTFVMTVHGFDSGENLGPYLEAIDLEELMG